MNLSQEQVKKMDLYICPECDDQENDNKKLENGEEASPKDESHALVTDSISQNREKKTQKQIPSSETKVRLLNNTSHYYVTNNSADTN